MEIFGIHETALQLKSKRAEVLANNLVNSSTPGFKARDFNFHQTLANEINQPNPRGTREIKLSYRVPMQPTTDGNTVETDVEQMLYAQNALDYKATLSFIRFRAANIIQALRGGE